MRRLALALPAVALLAGCNLTLPFDVTRDVYVAGPAGDVAYVEEVDLSAEEDLWSEREKIQELVVDRAEVAVLSVGTANAAEHVRVSLALRPDGAPADGSGDLVVLSGVELGVARGELASVAGSPALDAFLNDALAGAGRFALVARVATDGPVDARLGLRIAGSITLELVEKP
jgi:hypothetical protein